MRNSNLALDHIGFWCASLEESAEHFSKLMSVQIAPGGRHEGQGTWNRLVGAKDGQYVELIGKDPEQSAKGPMLEQAGRQRDLTACLVAYRSNALTELCVRAREIGMQSSGVQSMSRELGDGTYISWQLLFISHADFPILPFFIDWGDAPHPSTRLAPELKIADPIFQSPVPEQLSEAFHQLGLNASVVYGDTHDLVLSVASRAASASAGRQFGLTAGEDELRGGENTT
ncbi:MAG: VOC family protein [Pseudomonadota bacterium]